MQRFRSNMFSSGLVVGLFLVLIGVLLILDRFEYITISHVLHLWPAIIIAIGLARILSRVSFGMRLEGAFWMLAGCVLLASTLMLISINVWPLMLIFVGLLVIGHAGRSSARRQNAIKADEISDSG